MTLFFLLLGALFLLLLTVTLVLLVVGPTLLLKPRRRRAEFYRERGLPASPEEAGLRYEEIIIHTEDGLKLDCWLLRAEENARGTVVYLHGVADCKIDGLRLARSLLENGYHVLLYDSRGHGESGGLYCTYGYFEKHDVVSVIDYLRSRTDVGQGPIGIFGTSMGAAVAIQAASIDPRIRVIIAENSFATLRSIFDDYQKRMIKLPFHYLRNLVIKRSEIMAGFKANAVSPLEAVRLLAIPLLIIVAEKDHLIRAEYSKKLFSNASEPKQLFSIPDAHHSNTWDIAGKLYEDTITGFLNRYLV